MFPNEGLGRRATEGGGEGGIFGNEVPFRKLFSGVGIARKAFLPSIIHGPPKKDPRRAYRMEGKRKIISF
jgi:hypothetical protein